MATAISVPSRTLTMAMRGTVTVPGSGMESSLATRRSQMRSEHATIRLPKSPRAGEGKCGHDVDGKVVDGIVRTEHTRCRRGSGHDAGRHSRRVLHASVLARDLPKRGPAGGRGPADPHHDTGF